MSDYFSILGVQPGATQKEILSAYRKRLKVVHPDRFDPDTQPEEWQQANRMLRELNEAYQALRDGRTSESSQTRTEETKSNASGFSEKRKSSAHESRQQAKEEDPPHQQQRPSTSKGIVRCPLGSLSFNHIHYLKSLLSEKKWIARANGYPIALSYIGLFSSAFVYFTSVSEWSRLGTVVVESFWAGVAMLIVLGVIAGYCGANICLYHKAELKPCLLATPLYLIIVTYDEIRFAYAWEVGWLTFHGENWFPFFQIKIGDKTEKFHAHKMYDYGKFSQQWSGFRYFWETVGDRDGWLTANDILRDLKTTPVPRKAAMVFGGSMGAAVVATIAVCIVLSQSFTIVPESTARANRLQNYAAKEGMNVVNEAASPSTNIYEVAAQASLPGAVPAFNKPAKPLPANGKEYFYSGGKGVAPLKIKVPDNGEHYFAKVVSSDSNRPVKAVFIRSGNEVLIRVPLGTYRLKYAVGSTWYGREYLFGPGTSVSEADTNLDFHTDGEQVKGYTIRLIKQRDGNLQTKNINLEDF